MPHQLGSQLFQVLLPARSPRASPSPRAGIPLRGLASLQPAGGPVCYRPTAAAGPASSLLVHSADPWDLAGLARHAHVGFRFQKACEISSYRENWVSPPSTQGPPQTVHITPLYFLGEHTLPQDGPGAWSLSLAR